MRQTERLQGRCRCGRKKKLKANPLLHFEFKLADRLRMTRKQLLQAMDEEELYYWHAYDEMHYIGPDHDDIMAALAMVVNCQLWSKDRLRLDNFLVKWDKEEARENNKAALKQWAMSLPKAKQRKT